VDSGKVIGSDRRKSEFIYSVILFQRYPSSKTVILLASY